MYRRCGGDDGLRVSFADVAVCLSAGTLSGNPLAMTAGIKTLEILDRPGAYEHLDKVTSRWVSFFGGGSASEGGGGGRPRGNVCVGGGEAGCVLCAWGAGYFCSALGQARFDWQTR
jgi:hypothetical protein